MARPRKEYIWGEEIKNGIVFLEELQGTPLNNNTTTERRVKVLCPRCKQPFITQLRKITRSSNNVVQCQECSKKDQQQRCRKNGYKIAKNLIGQRFGRLVVSYRIYKEGSPGALWYCNCDCGGHVITTSYKLITNHTQSCGCLKSKGEELLGILLTQLQIDFIKEYCFKDCINPKTNGLLRFDFYLPDYNICIEYDGKQHFEESGLCSDSLEDRQYKDNIKNQYCKDNNIKLIRIPYTDFNKLNEHYILDILL